MKKSVEECQSFSPYWCEGLDCEDCKCFIPKSKVVEQTEIIFE